MRKLLLLLFLAFCAISCNMKSPEPIEKYGGSKYVITNIYTASKGSGMTLKNADTIFDITVLRFDRKRYNVGDTIR